MTITQQAAIVLDAVEHKLLRVEGIIRWADSALIAEDKPESWLIELSTFNPNDLTGVVNILRRHASGVLPLRWRVQVIVLAYAAGLLNVASSLPLLFRVVILEPNGGRKDALDERLHTALVEWDCQENLEAIPTELQARLETQFREYLIGAQKIAAVLHGTNKAVA